MYVLQRQKTLGLNQYVCSVFINCILMSKTHTFKKPTSIWWYNSGSQSIYYLYTHAVYGTYISDSSAWPHRLGNRGSLQGCIGTGTLAITAPLLATLCISNLLIMSIDLSLVSRFRITFLKHLQFTFLKRLVKIVNEHFEFWGFTVCRRNQVSLV